MIDGQSEEGAWLPVTSGVGKIVAFLLERCGVDLPHCEKEDSGKIKMEKVAFRWWASKEAVWSSLSSPEEW